MFRSLLLVLVCACCFAMAFGGEKPCVDEAQEQQEPFAVYYRSSAFLHGYRHGYEQGFHRADIESHMAHAMRQAEEYADYRDVKWRASFGNRELFTLGFRAGYQIGFEDMRQGRDLRVFDNLETLRAADKENRLLGSVGIDPALARGYLSAVDSRLSQSIKLSSGPACLHAQAGSDYCAVFRLGKALADADAPGRSSFAMAATRH